ncbi:hypothetical protein BD626DRAFT_476902 [Schizophyllum amplum]|uniref:RING-type domain-containing protein n=1 Tax=Schizophyllum amplum TaxID=97359 RepID=A0A550CZR1_9AGAR|nr:hypothetical protein BD626DRAFT_476902 [Auriculariopsis ampla]
MCSLHNKGRLLYAATLCFRVGHVLLSPLASRLLPLRRLVLRTRNLQRSIPREDLKPTVMAFSNCAICFEEYQFPAEGRVFPACGHVICDTCARQSWDKCPICRAHTYALTPRRLFVEVSPEIKHVVHASAPTAPTGPSKSEAAVDVNANGSYDIDNADKGCNALEALADIPHLDSMTRAYILRAARILDKDLRPALADLRTERAEKAELLETKAILLKRVQECQDRLAKLEAEYTATSSTLQRTEAALRARSDEMQLNMKEMQTLRTTIRGLYMVLDGLRATEDKLTAANTAMQERLGNYERQVNHLVVW